MNHYPRKQTRKCYDTTKTIFWFYDQFDDVDDTSGFQIGIDLTLYIMRRKWIEDPEFYVHEFCEITIIKILRRWNRRFTIRWDIKFKGFKSTSVPHLISPFGDPNGRNLTPCRKSP